jgi:hypothetical protein
VNSVYKLSFEVVGAKPKAKLKMKVITVTVDIAHG